jgi:hypothetical protein
MKIQIFPKKAKIGQKGQKKHQKAKFAKKKPKLFLANFWLFWQILLFWKILYFLEQVAVCHFGGYIRTT